MTKMLSNMLPSSHTSSPRRDYNNNNSQLPTLMVRDPPSLGSRVLNSVQANSNDFLRIPERNSARLANTSKPVGINPQERNSGNSVASSNDTDSESQDGGGGDDDDGDDRVLIQRVHYASHLATSWTQRKKWYILIVGGLAQLSMNLNTTLYSNAQKGIAAHYGVSVSQAVWGAAAFLITYAFGCELWAPWSEEFGRRRVLQLSLFLVNCFCLLAALAPNFPTLLAARALGGLSTAGGSVTLAMITDMYGPDDTWFQYATNFMALASLLGSVVGAVVGGFVEAYLPWQWCMWLQLLFGGAVQLLHLAVVPETRSTVVMDKVAKRLRKASGGDPATANVYGPGELATSATGFGWREYAEAQWRPFHMLLREPIVTALALLSGFSDALIFMFVQSFGLIYGGDDGWGFGTVGVSLAFVPIGLGYVVAWLTFIPAIRRNARLRAANPASEHAQYEARLWWLNFTAPALSVGLLLFALVACLPGVTARIHWMPSMVASGLIGVANYAIYMATIDYTLRAYGVYAASATGGNGWARDFLAGVLTPFAVPMFERAGKFPMMMILFALALVLTASVYVVYFKGPWLRRRSRFAQTLASRGDEATAAQAEAAPQEAAVGNNNNNNNNNNDNDQQQQQQQQQHGDTEVNAAPPVVKRANVEYLEKQDLPGSRAASRSNTPAASRRNTPAASRRNTPAASRRGSVEMRSWNRRQSYHQQGQQHHHHSHHHHPSSRPLGPPPVSLAEAVERVVTHRAEEGEGNGRH